MRNNQCIICGQLMLKSGLNDPFICRGCEKESETVELNRYGYLDEM